MGGCTPGYVPDTFTSHYDVSISNLEISNAINRLACKLFGKIICSTSESIPKIHIGLVKSFELSRYVFINF